jgi:C-terminal processing protease CtpA/Prc
VVLVNGMSASASEIVAAALQETQRGTVIGETTYGKGTVQQVYRHAGDTALKLTVGRYYTASGQPVADRSGRRPDVVVTAPDQLTATDLLRRRIDASDMSEEDRTEVLTLIDALPTQEPVGQPIGWSMQPDERAAHDPVIAAALDHLRN